MFWPPYEYRSTILLFSKASVATDYSTLLQNPPRRPDPPCPTIHPANMLGADRKAIVETIREAFGMVLTGGGGGDVEALSLTVFGGLTLRDVIARVIVLVFGEVGVCVPAVDRLWDESGRSVRSCEYSTKCGDGED